MGRISCDPKRFRFLAGMLKLLNTHTSCLLCLSSVSACSPTQTQPPELTSGRFDSCRRQYTNLYRWTKNGSVDSVRLLERDWEPVGRGWRRKAGHGAVIAVPGAEVDVPTGAPGPSAELSPDGAVPYPRGYPPQTSWTLVPRKAANGGAGGVGGVGGDGDAAQSNVWYNQVCFKHMAP